MKKIIQVLSLTLLCNAAPGAIVTVGPWRPIYKGVELASGRQQDQTGSELDQQVLCLRVDLTDPDIVLFTTPRCTNCGGYDTLSENTSRFLEQYDVQVAVNRGFYTSSSGGRLAAGNPGKCFWSGDLARQSRVGGGQFELRGCHAFQLE